MGFCSGELNIGGSFANEIWGTYFRGGGREGGLLWEFYGIVLIILSTEGTDVLGELKGGRGALIGERL